MDRGKFFATDAITDHALDFLEKARKTGKPWLLYTAYQAPHFPVQAPPELSATYGEVYEKGWDALRAQRLESTKKLGLVEAGPALPPRGPIDRLDVAKRLGSMTADGLNPAWESLPLEGRSLLPALAGRPATPRTLVFEHERDAALMEGDWKLVGQKVISRNKLADDAKWELYDLGKDPAEQNDLSNEEPERLARMIKTLEREARRTLVLPAP